MISGALLLTLALTGQNPAFGFVPPQATAQAAPQGSFSQESYTQTTYAAAPQAAPCAPCGSGANYAAQSYSAQAAPCAPRGKFKQKFKFKAARHGGRRACGGC
jgi:hypothetical protein